MKNALLMPDEFSQLPQHTKILHQLGVLAPPLGGFGLVLEAVSVLLTTKTNLAKANELFQLLQAKNIVSQLPAWEGQRGVVTGRCVTALFTHTKNVADANELAEHEVATFGYEEPVLRFDEL